MVPRWSLAVNGVADGLELLDGGMDDVLVLRSSFLGRCRPGCIEGDDGGSFFTTILGLPPLRSLQDRGQSEREYMGETRTYDLGEPLPASRGEYSFEPDPKSV